LLEKKLAVSSPQLAKTIIKKTLDSLAWRSLPTVSIHVLLNFFGYIVQGSVESFNVEKVVWVQSSDNVTNYSPPTNSSFLCFAVHSSISNLSSRMACTLYGAYDNKKGGLLHVFEETPRRGGRQQPHQALLHVLEKLTQSWDISRNVFFIMIFCY
jgi:hypothetical protein